MFKRILVVALWLPVWAFAQGYPSKPVRIVLPFGPGGVADITTRTIAPKMSEGLGQQVVVENMPGAGGIRAAETVARAEPDGHTLLLLTNGNAVSQALFKSLPYDPVNDFAMISTVGFFSMVIVTGADSKAKTLQEAIAMAKANPGKMNIGTITPGGTQHLAGELFRSTAGIDALVVPHKTTGEVIIAARNGNVDLAVDFIAPLLSSIKSGALRPLAMTAGKRFPGLPDVPTAIEAGVGGYDVASWNALAAPAKTPRAVIERVHQELAKALAAPEVQKRFAELGV
jgi:tripartite-type tricarboxylate transporter receptor subunit TctC